jgi:predicted nucleic acid-binding protein
MSLIVDASVATKWYLAETDSSLAQQLVEAGHELIAPDLLLVEVASAFFKAWSREIIDDGHMDRALSQLPTAFAALWPLQELVADAMVISRILRHPVYDCVYLALAWRTGDKIVTADDRFLEVARASTWDHFLIRLRDAV